MFGTLEGQMNLERGGASEAQFAEFVAGLGTVIGHAERIRPLRDYCTEPDVAGRAQER
jgi:hypothetical protein